MGKELGVQEGKGKLVLQLGLRKAAARFEFRGVGAGERRARGCLRVCALF